MKKLIMDLDVGVDDALALAYALTLKEYELIGITSTFGNVSQKQGQLNALTILHALGRDDIPVYPGALARLGMEGVYEPSAFTKTIHGNDGIGDAGFASPIRKPETESALEFLSSSIQKYGKDLVLYASGPQTNLALLYQTYPELAEKTGKIVIMGGAFHWPGNVSPYAEANIHNDAIAADYLFSLGLDITLVGLDVTERLFLYRSDSRKWKSAVGGLFRKMTDFYIDFHDAKPGEEPFCFLHDPAAVCFLAHPDYFKVEICGLSVSTNSSNLGMIIEDKDNIRPKTSKVCIDVDCQKAEIAMKDSWSLLFC